MRIGLGFGHQELGLADLVSAAGRARADGFVGLWMGQASAWDPLTALAVIGSQVPELPLGTAIVPTYPRHPLALASQALTAQAATGNRLTLGIGPSHRMIIENQYGHSFARPARHVSEYLSALAPLLNGETVAYQGETLKAAGKITVPGAEPPPLLLAAMGPQLLRIAGEQTDGTIIMWAGPKTIADYIVPAITRAAAGRPAPRVVAGVLVCVTADEAGARARAAEQFAVAGSLPSYRAVLDREGAAGPQDVVLAGDEAAVERDLRRLSAAGATEFIAFPIGSAAEQADTVRLLAALCG